MCFYFAKLCFFSWKITVRGLVTSYIFIIYALVCIINRDKAMKTTIRVPTAPGNPGKITTVFPVLEKYWNFIILLKILEKWE